MTTKNSITKDLDELLEYLDIDQLTLRKLVHAGVERLLGPQIDNRIEPYLRSSPQNNKGDLA